MNLLHWLLDRLFGEVGDEAEDWRLAHRWDALAAYNTARSRGIVHEPEYVEFMREEQAAFQAEKDEERELRSQAARRLRKRYGP